MEYRYRDASEMKDSGVEWIGNIPKDWTISRIDKEFNVRNEKVSDKEYPPLSVTKQGILPQLENVAKSDNGDNRKKVCVGDFVINSRADRKGSCGVSIYDGSVSLICNVLTPKKLHPQYVHSLFRNYYFSEEFYRWGSGIVDDLWSTNIEKMKKINIPIPMGEEDEKIANFLDKKTSQFDSIISKKEALIEKLEEAKKSLISEVVTGKVKVVKSSDGYDLVKRSSDDMKDSGVEWIGEIPKDWEVKRIKQISNVISKGTTPSTIGREIADNGKIRFLKAENIYDGDICLTPQFFIDEETNKILKRSELKEHDVLFVIAGATIGKTAIVKKAHCPANTNQAISFIRLYNNINYKFVYFWLSSPKLQENMWLYAVQSAQPNLSMENLGNFHIVYPNKEEIDIITDYIEINTIKICEIMESIRYQIQKLKEAKQSLISEAVTGKIEILD
ncbi:restriction endonuclease subunit S [Intestinibacter bartlettii]|nr:restriction endonuclease subunit S [Intestinibacter bartlettii]MDU1253644.1 restriction endonuclease subunit S [Peptostreptococcaceae bacterium]MCB5745589.1 restriction endonuclease subunit S [Intestinibacter bartlettii]MCC2706129.1 restriction endonuclease subunit S [Intestinibacter bartlettii]MCC2761579.1 restriction endonuclease subunit S [Intestinibacter bartlettii]MDU4257632.1 restriction endonuclease subunit S [Intestinibacter bartlettii]